MRLLTTLLILLSIIVQAQDVLIPAPVAAFYLEEHDRVGILTQQVDSLHSGVRLLEQKDSTSIKLLAIEHAKQPIYDSLVELKDEDIRSFSNENRYLNKELKQEKHKTKFIAISGGILILLALLL